MKEYKKKSFSYEDTDKKIEINLYGLDFEIKNLNSVKEIKEIDGENKNDVELEIEQLLGKGSIERINNKRKNDGHDEMDINIELAILGLIMKVYTESSVGNFDSQITEIKGDVESYSNNLGNREQRRNYNRNYRNNNYKGNYRRY